MKNIQINHNGIQQNDTLTEKIIGACFEVHNQLGPGFNEKIYKEALKFALKKVCLEFRCEKKYPVHYHGYGVGKFRADLVVEDKIIVEIKAINGFMPKSFLSQVIAYLKASKLKTGLLVNFGDHSCIIRKVMNKDPYNHRNQSKSPKSLTSSPESLIPSPESFQRKRR
jgi:GxxExxY protein